MSLRVVGAGLGRTGTHSLKLALEQLLGGPCYHMIEVFGRPEQAEAWHAAAQGRPPAWDAFLADYRATVDWPAAAFWRQLHEAFPEAVVVLSTRSSPEAWWKSASDTIFSVLARPVPEGDEGGLAELAMIDAVLSNTFTPQWREEKPAMAAYEAHNAAVRAGVAPGRLVEWQPGDGWGPLCAALGLDVPEEPFPHVNSTADFRAMTGLDATPA
ncbi:MAG: sulfotransferase family protein [Acidimicrobiales bacterium]|jgi:hypothetical protein